MIAVFSNCMKFSYHGAIRNQIVNEKHAIQIQQRAQSIKWDKFSFFNKKSKWLPVELKFYEDPLRTISSASQSLGVSAVNEWEAK